MCFLKKSLKNVSFRAFLSFFEGFYYIEGFESAGTKKALEKGFKCVLRGFHGVFLCCLKLSMFIIFLSDTSCTLPAFMAETFR